jgi:hypothetical protein
MNVDVRPPNEAGDVANRGLIRPPLVYLISLIEGGLVQLAAPLPFLPDGLLRRWECLLSWSPLLCSGSQLRNSGRLAHTLAWRQAKHHDRPGRSLSL